MISWVGSVISGSKGSSLVDNRRRVYDSLAIKKVNKSYGTNFKNFRPWMSNADLGLGAVSLGSDYTTRNFQLNENTLNQLSKIIGDDGKNLKMIHKNSNGRIGVLLPDNPNFKGQYQQLNSCIECLRKNNPFFYQRLESIVDEIIIQCSTDANYTLREGGTGLSSFDYRKGVFLSIPTSKYWEADLLINLWHELGHQSLITLQLDDKIINESHMSKVFSVIRNTERPAILSFHAMIACLFMLEFLVENHNWLISISSEKFIEDYIKGTRAKINCAIGTIKDLSLTDLGKAILNECMAMYIYSERYLVKCEVS